MRVFPDTDLMVFLYTLGRIVVLGPLHLAQNRSRRAIPTTLQYEELSPASLTDAQQKYLQTYDRKFAEVNYQPTSTYRTTNFGKNLIRSYVNPLESVRAIVMIVEVTVNVNGVVSSAHSCTLEFVSCFTDGTYLVTRNMQRKTLFDDPPFRVTQECPRVSDPGELRRRHLSKLEKLGRTPLSPPSDFASIVKEIKEQHQRFSQFQVERGAYRLNPTSGCYETTPKIHWRGIRNHLNPFLHLRRLPTWRFAVAALIGIGAPALTAMLVAPAAANRAQELGLPSFLGSGLMTLAAYALAGIAIGYCVQKSNFLWSFTLTYLGVGAVLGFHSYPLPYSTFAATIAHVVAQSAKRKRLILQPPLFPIPIVGRQPALPK